MRPGRWFLYFDPLEALSPENQARWRIAGERHAMLRDALSGAGADPRVAEQMLAQPPEGAEAEAQGAATGRV